jgi:hypothetical protein
MRTPRSPSARGAERFRPSGYPGWTCRPSAVAVYQDDEPAKAEPAPETVEATPDAVEAVGEDPATEHSPAEATDLTETTDLAETTDAADLAEVPDHPAVDEAEAPLPQVAAAAMAAEPADGRRIDLYTRRPETRLDELAGRARELRQRCARSRSNRIVT